MYTFDSRVRYSETDESGRLSLTGIMNYLQDCSTLQSQDIGMGIAYLNRKRRAWWLNSWQIVVHRTPGLGEEITVGTWPYDFRGIYGFRNFVIRDRGGSHLVEADSCWFYYDLEKGCPTRVQPEDIRGYGQGQDRLSMEQAPRKIALTGDFLEGEAMTVGRHHLDTNHHVNNAQYVEMAKELLPHDISIRELRAEYKNAAVLGDVVIPKFQQKDSCFTVSLCGRENQVFANLWFAVEKREDLR